MADEILALWHDNKASSSLHCETSPDSDLLPITALYSMISTGTEKLVSTGAIDDEFADKMSVQHQQGCFSLPIKYGYSMVGLTQEQHLVHLMHPHQSVAFAEPQQLYELPETIAPEAAALISNMETVINAIWDSELFYSAAQLKNKKVAIVGFGNIGALLAVTLRKTCAVEPVIIEPDPWRRSKATELGMTQFQADSDGTFDVIFHSTGSESGLHWCLSRAAYEGVIIDLSWYGTKQLSLSLGREFHYQRLRLISSQVSQIPGHKPQESYHSRKVKCAELLLDPVYQSLITAKIPFTQSPQFFAQLRSQQLPNGLIWLFDYQNKDNTHV